MMKNKVKEILRNLTNKEYIYLVRRGNIAIKFLIKNKEILIPDHGGWITYKQFPKSYEEVKSDYGLIDLDDLKKKVKNKKIFLVNSLAGYFVEQDMEKIVKICKDKCLVFNDVSGSIGRESAKFGDYIFGSFGKWKVVDLDYGGFVSCNKEIDIKEDFDESKLKELYFKLKNIKRRIEFLDKVNKKVKDKLKNYGIIHKNSYSLNVIVKYKSLKEKEELVKYCSKNKYEFTLCPRYIRVNEEAVSIELKRLDDKLE